MEDFGVDGILQSDSSAVHNCEKFIRMIATNAVQDIRSIQAYQHK